MTFMADRGLHRGTDVTHERQRGRDEALDLVWQFGGAQAAQSAAERLADGDASRETHQHTESVIRDWGEGRYCTGCGSGNVGPAPAPPLPR